MQDPILQNLPFTVKPAFSHTAERSEPGRSFVIICFNFPYYVVYLTGHKSPCCVIVSRQSNYTIKRWFVPFLQAGINHKYFRLSRVRQVDWMEFREIVTFMEVAQLKSFSRAAEKLGY